MEEEKSYLLVIGEAEALRWIVDQERMAFALRRRKDAEQLNVGDRLLLFTTRGCWHNPGRDQSRVAGEARIVTEARVLAEPVEIAGAEYALDCRLKFTTLAPMRTGVELAPLVDRLTMFPDRRSWPVRVRRTLVPTPRRDANLLRRELHKLVPEGTVDRASYR